MTGVIYPTQSIGTKPALVVAAGGSGPLALFLHGIGGCRSNWYAQMEALAPHFSVVAWDMRGYGDSGDFDGPLTTNDLCCDVDRILDYFQAKDAHIVGLSMGGMIALEYYRRRPERCRTLALCNTNCGLGVMFSPTQIEEFVRLRRQSLLVKKFPEDFISEMLPELLGGSPPVTALQGITASLGRLRLGSYAKAIDAIVRYDSSDMLESISVPTLVISSTGDRVIPQSTSRILADRIPDAVWAVIDGAGHLSNMERPAQFNEVLIRFLLGYEQRRAKSD